MLFGGWHSQHHNITGFLKKRSRGWGKAIEVHWIHTKSDSHRTGNPWLSSGFTWPLLEQMRRWLEKKKMADRRWIPNFNTLVVFRGLAFCESVCIDLFFSGISSFPQYSQYVCTRLPCPQDVSRTCTVLFISMWEGDSIPDNFCMLQSQGLAFFVAIVGFQDLVNMESTERYQFHGAFITHVFCT